MKALVGCILLLLAGALRADVQSGGVLSSRLVTDTGSSESSGQSNTIQYLALTLGSDATSGSSTDSNSSGDPTGAIDGLSDPNGGSSDGGLIVPGAPTQETKDTGSGSTITPKGEVDLPPAVPSPGAAVLGIIGLGSIIIRRRHRVA